MGVTNFPGGASPASPTGAFSSDSGEVYSDSITFPGTVRLAADGVRHVQLARVRAYIAGRFADVTCHIRIGSAETAGFTNGIDDTDPPPITAWQSIVGMAFGGSSYRVALRGSAAYRVGRGAVGTTHKTSTGFTWSDGALCGQAEWYESPSAPQSLNANPNSTPGELDLTWASPSSDGGTAITGYRIEYATDAAFTLGLGDADVGVVTSHTLTGLTPGLTYYVRVRAKNSVTTTAGTYSVASSAASALLGTVPDAPTGITVTPAAGLVSVGWTAPASDGGVAIDSYRIEVATDSGFTSIISTLDVGPTIRAKTVTGLTPATTYYARVRAHNSVGYGANGTAANAATPARDVLDIIQSAALSLTDGTQVEIRSDGADNPTLTLGYVAFGTGSTFVTIATITDGLTSGTFYAPGGPRNLALVADPSGNLYVIGTDGADTSKMLVHRYERTGPTAWVLDGVLSQSLTNTGDAITGYAATYVPGTNPSPVPSILVMARRAGTTGAGALSFATLNLTNIEASTGSLFIASGNDPSWLGTPPGAAAPNTAPVDVAPLVNGGTRIGILANGYAIVDVVNGVVSTVAKAANGTTTVGPWARVIGVNATAVGVLAVVGGALSWAFYSTSGSLLGSGSYAGANAFGGAFSKQWDAFYDRTAQTVTVYYVADTAGARTLESIDISASTYAATSATVLTSALGAASTTNGAVRIPQRIVDERRVLVAAANIVTATSAKSVAAYVDTSGNVAPNAPALVDESGFDASADRTLSWAFSDDNSLDTQTAYELVIERVSDSVAIVSTGKVASTTPSRLIAAATLTNGVNYRWRARTWDVLDVQGAWAAFDTFTTAALGTLTITNPVADNPVGYDLATVPLTWSYVQADDYVQTQRRIRVIRVSDSVVLSDTTMQASTDVTANVAVPTDVPVRIELSIVTNAPGTPTVTANRLLTSSYSTPVPPLVYLTAGVSFINITVDNPTPTGAKPEVVTNIIERRLASTADPWVAIQEVGYNGDYNDHAVKSGTAYEYRVRGQSA